MLQYVGLVLFYVWIIMGYVWVCFGMFFLYLWVCLIYFGKFKYSFVCKGIFLEVAVCFVMHLYRLDILNQHLWVKFFKRT